ncbi:hypothetical protein M407DRAFT_20919 [Tulasnella calospora MUT 4182]|uniref:Uncharacterized protein n=1 Tax=Tulasnella calospora MUT 4182 TaxID=1051891 RepID=A0A0C3L897_9AGAM|nr:hypothetical protein M407DRAFT_20919 [Tulasnella calospora MUT 4182]
MKRSYSSVTIGTTWWNNTPSLWMKIRKTAGIPNARVIHSLEKSKDYPLEIMCDISSRDMWESAQDAFLNTIFPHAHRWRKVSLHLGGDGQDLGPMATISTPLLESISLSTNHYSGWAQDWQLNIFGDRPPPRLRELFLAGIPVPWSSTFLCNLIVLGISQMEYLAPSLDQLLGVLSACPCLESLTVQNVTFAGGANAISLNAVHMAALGRLELEGMASETINLLLAAIHAPNCKFGALRCFVPGDPLVRYAGGPRSNYARRTSRPSTNAETPTSNFVILGFLRAFWGLRYMEVVNQLRLS